MHPLVDLLEAFVCADLDALATALYVTIDDLFGRRRGPGRRPRISDAELACLAVLQVLLGYSAERHFLRYAHTHLRGLFPGLPGQSSYNRRLRRLTPRLQQVLHHLAVASPSWCDQLRLLDSTPIPCAASRQTVDRSALGPYAAYGYCRSHSRWFWGVRLMLLAAPDGMPIGYCLAPANRPERQVALLLLARSSVAGQTIIGDKGFAGRQFQADVTALGARFVRPDRRDEPTRHGQLGWVRQRIESVFDTLKGQHHWSATAAAPPEIVHPHHPAAAGPGRLHLAQLAARPAPPLPDRLRPLNRITHLGPGSRIITAANRADRNVQVAPADARTPKELTS